MTAPADEKVPENLASDEWYTADDPGPDDIPAGQDDDEPAAPYGLTLDRETGKLRPKKRPGRPKIPPGADELAAAPPLERGQDEPPGKPGKGTRPPPGPEPPMPKGGVIAAGVNKLYRRAGRIVRAMDHDTGTAIIECTKRDPSVPPDEQELTVGEAWENLAKVNPRIRRFLLGVIAGGAWGDLVMAHAPIGIALFMKPAVQRILPWHRLIESMAEPDEDTPQGEGNLPGGMTADDFGQVSEMAQSMARRAAARVGVQVSEEEMVEAKRRAEAMMAGRGITPPYEQHDLPPDEAAGDGVPPAFRRQQPKRTTRAARTHR